MNGKQFGHIAEPGFMRAFLKVWLGDRPAQVDLKDRLLGLSAADVKH
jgi:long-chain acyl-CoA synthetase